MSELRWQGPGLATAGLGDLNLVRLLLNFPQPSSNRLGNKGSAT